MGGRGARITEERDKANSGWPSDPAAAAAILAEGPSLGRGRKRNSLRREAKRGGKREEMNGERKLSSKAGTGRVKGGERGRERAGGRERGANTRYSHDVLNQQRCPLKYAVATDVIHSNVNASLVHYGVKIKSDDWLITYWR